MGDGKDKKKGALRKRVKKRVAKKINETAKKKKKENQENHTYQQKTVGHKPQDAKRAPQLSVMKAMWSWNIWNNAWCNEPIRRKST